MNLKTQSIVIGPRAEPREPELEVRKTKRIWDRKRSGEFIGTTQSAEEEVKIPDRGLGDSNLGGKRKTAGTALELLTSLETSLGLKLEGRLLEQVKILTEGVDNKHLRI